MRLRIRFNNSHNNQAVSWIGDGGWKPTPVGWLESVGLHLTIWLASSSARTPLILYWVPDRHVGFLHTGIK